MPEKKAIVKVCNQTSTFSLLPPPTPTPSFLEAVFETAQSQYTRYVFLQVTGEFNFFLFSEGLVSDLP